MQNTNLEELAEVLRQSGKYQVLTRFEKIKKYNDRTNNNDEVKIGLFLDVETTGLDFSKDKIIELALVPFEFSKDGRIYNILESYTALQDPGVPISDEVTAITGITNEMVAGQNIDVNKVKELLGSAVIIIAHNAAFDRKFFDKQFGLNEMPRRVWACTQTQIPWSEEDIKSHKLEYIAYKYGFFYDAHRAEIDCLVGIHILAQKLPISKGSVLKAMLDIARQSTSRIWAYGSPIESKDTLKARGYIWNSNRRSWFKDVTIAEDKEPELDFLRQEIYHNDKEITVDEISAFDRFSDRV